MGRFSHLNAKEVILGGEKESIACVGFSEQTVRRTGEVEKAC